MLLCCCCGYQLSQGLTGKWGALAGMGHLRPKSSQFAPPDLPPTSEAGQAALRFPEGKGDPSGGRLWPSLLQGWLWRRKAGEWQVTLNISIRNLNIMTCFCAAALCLTTPQRSERMGWRVPGSSEGRESVPCPPDALFLHVNAWPAQSKLQQGWQRGAGLGAGGASDPCPQLAV